MIDEVYLDMDGVLTNWDYQIDFYNARKPTGKANWDKVCKIGAKFWIDMPWLLEGHDLYLGILELQKKYNFKLGVLSAIFSNSKYLDFQALSRSKLNLHNNQYKE